MCVCPLKVVLNIGGPTFLCVPIQWQQLQCSDYNNQCILTQAVFQGKKSFYSIDSYVCSALHLDEDGVLGRRTKSQLNRTNLLLLLQRILLTLSIQSTLYHPSLLLHPFVLQKKKSLSDFDLRCDILSDRWRKCNDTISGIK